MIVAFDTETFLITPGLLAPPLVCVTTFDGTNNDLHDAQTGVLKIRDLLVSGATLIGHNVAYDFGVLCAANKHLLPLVFNAYEHGRIRDTKIRQKLFDLSEGTLKWEQTSGGKAKEKRYSLAELSEKHLGQFLDKSGDTWRLKYDQLVDVPTEWWPPEAKQYALNDAKTTFEVFQKQNYSFKQKPHMITNDIVRNERDQAQAAWALHLISVWGIRTDGDAVSKLQAELEIEKARLGQAIVDSKLIRPNGSKDTEAIRARIEKAYGDRPIPRTEKTQKIQTSASVLNESGDPVLETLVEFEETAKLLSDFIPKITAGTKVPINCSYDEMVASGRTSAYRINIQQLPRKGKIRECFVPRPGYVFIGADYAILELATLAQVCLDVLGESSLAEALRKDRDPHVMVAAQLLSMDYDEAYAKKSTDQTVKDYRQLCKVMNYGLPGGMSPQTFVTYAAGQGFSGSKKITIRQAEEGRNAWFDTWLEMKKYFAWVGSQLGAIGEAEIQQRRSGRMRYVHSFTSACNTFFQGLAADGAKEALFRVSKECYLPGTALYGSRPVAFIHDEIIAEAPEAKAPEAADRLAQVMIEGMKVYVTDVPIKAEPFMMRKWIKGAQTVRDSNGRLQMWEA